MTGDDLANAESIRTGRRVWLLTFTDLSALMLAFFVMLFSMSTLDVEKWQAVVSRLHEDSPPKPQIRLIPTAPNAIPTVDESPALPLGYLGRVLEEKLQRDEVLAHTVVQTLDGLVVVSLPADALFEPGKTELSDAARQALFRVSGAMTTIGNRIDVQGHVDDSGEGTVGSDAKWLLSLSRAVAVANELKRIGYPQQVTMLGLADSRFRHLDPGIPPAERSALGRRVDLVIHPTKGGD